MHPLLMQKLAQQRREDLRREAEVWRAVSGTARHGLRSFVAGMRRDRRRHSATPGVGGVAPAPAVYLPSRW